MGRAWLGLLLLVACKGAEEPTPPGPAVTPTVPTSDSAPATPTADTGGSLVLALAEAGPDRTVAVGESVAFDALSEGVSFLWDLGDGTQSSEPAPSHSWSEPGTYSVVVRATGADGGTDSDTAKVVVHPPFRWQGKYASTFTDAVRTTEQKHGIEVAVENMFPWSMGGADRQAYLPGIDPSEMDVDHATLDFSHCALARRDSMELALDLGDRLRHLHLTDGVAADEDKVFDEHLIPGHGNEPVAEVLQMLAAKQWTGQVIAEIKTRHARSERDRLRLLVETLEFAREHLGQTARVAAEPPPSGAEAAPEQG